MAHTASAILADDEERQAFGRFYVTSKGHMGMWKNPPQIPQRKQAGWVFFFHGSIPF